MKRILAKVNFGFAGTNREQEFEFTNDCTNEEIDEAIWDWATSFVDATWDEVYAEDDDND